MATGIISCSLSSSNLNLYGIWLILIKKYQSIHRYIRLPSLTDIKYDEHFVLKVTPVNLTTYLKKTTIQKQDVKTYHICGCGNYFPAYFVFGMPKIITLKYKIIFVFFINYYYN